MLGESYSDCRDIWFLTVAHMKGRRKDCVCSIYSFTWVSSESHSRAFNFLWISFCKHSCIQRNIIIKAALSGTSFCILACFLPLSVFLLLKKKPQQNKVIKEHCVPHSSEANISLRQLYTYEFMHTHLGNKVCMRVFLHFWLRSFFWSFFCLSCLCLTTAAGWRRGRVVVEVGFPDCPFAQPSLCTGLITLSPPPLAASPYSSFCPKLLCSADRCPWQSHPGILSSAQAHFWPCLSACVCVYMCGCVCACVCVLSTCPFTTLSCTLTFSFCLFVC